jgi:hypothetical protein
MKSKAHRNEKKPGFDTGIFLTIHLMQTYSLNYARLLVSRPCRLPGVQLLVSTLEAITSSFILMTIAAVPFLLRCIADRVSIIG